MTRQLRRDYVTIPDRLEPFWSQLYRRTIKVKAANHEGCQTYYPGAALNLCL
jgi:hypothetical protein